MQADDAAGPVTGSGWPGRAGRPADPESLTALTALAEVDAAGLSGSELVDGIVAAGKALSLLLGIQIRMMAALAVPFIAGDPMRLAARLARKNNHTGDDSAEHVQRFVEEAATSLAGTERAAAL